jgi:glycosyltransferase involved in cell wall biosynthesis
METTPKKPEISVFFPAHNEETIIEKTVTDAIAAISPIFSDFEIIIVNDGSTDKTGKIIDNLARNNPKIRAVHHPENKGYGAAIKSGLASATKNLIFYTDGDHQFDVSEIRKLLPLLDEADLIIGYRIKRQDPFHRLLFGKMFGLLIGILFNLWAKDIDCAFKLIKRKVLENIELKSDGAMISSELLIKAKKKGFKIKQVGIHHYPRKAGKPSGANIKVVIKAFYELFKFWRELR